MQDDEKTRRTPRIANLGDRRQSLVAQGVKAALTQDQPTLGGNQGDYVRPPCGTCLSWRRVKAAGNQNIPLNMGACMWGPPTPHPVQNEMGQTVAQALMRPTMTADHEGCDQHDDGTGPDPAGDDDDDDDDDGGGESSLIAKAG